jgi:tetratricopeptide (TPR) repeat protein
LKQDDSVFEIIGLKRAICYIELKQYNLAEEDINKILKVNQRNCEAIYFKGLISFYKKQYS